MRAALDPSGTPAGFTANGFGTFQDLRRHIITGDGPLVGFCEVLRVTVGLAPDAVVVRDRRQFARQLDAGLAAGDREVLLWARPPVISLDVGAKGTVLVS